MFAARYEAAITWINYLDEGEFEEAATRAHPAVAAQLGASQLQEAWDGLAVQLGALVSLESKSQSMDQGLNVVVLKGVFQNATLDVQVYMSDDHEVAGFFVRPPS